MRYLKIIPKTDHSAIQQAKILRKKFHHMAERVQIRSIQLVEDKQEQSLWTTKFCLIAAITHLVECDERLGVNADDRQA